MRSVINKHSMDNSTWALLDIFSYSLCHMCHFGMEPGMTRQSMRISHGQSGKELVIYDSSRVFLLGSCVMLVLAKFLLCWNRPQMMPT